MPLPGSDFGRASARQFTTFFTRGGRRVAWLAALVALAVASPPPAGAQGQTGVIIGRVTDAATGGPIASANVVISGTQLGTLTGEDGRFTLRNIQAGNVELVVNRIGYEAKRTAVTVLANQSASANVALTQAAFSLSAVVTTVTGATRKVELANSTTQIAVADKIAELPVTSLGQVLSGRSSGVQVISEGSTGGGSRIRIRGQSSLSLSNNPIVIIDGVRATSATNSSFNGIGGGGPSRLDDLNPDEIESMEVIKGPSAATLYGTEAANGVISIITKRGKSGRTRYNVYSENGLISDPRKGEYPELWALWGKSRNLTTGVTGTVSARCNITAQAAGTCIADSVSRGNVLNIDSLSPIDQGQRQQYGMQISGGTDRVQFFISGETENETGVYRMPQREIDRLTLERGVGSLPSFQVRPNALARNSIRANLSSQLADNLFVQVSSAFVTSNLRLPQNNDNSTGLMVNALGSVWDQSLKDVDGVPLAGYRSYGMGDVFSRTNNQGINRFINSVQSQWTPLSWLATRATVGIDYTARVDREFNRVGEGAKEGQTRLGASSLDRSELVQTTVDLGSTLSFGLGSSIQSKTSFGMQYVRNLAANTGASGIGLPPGSLTVDATTLSRAPSEDTDDRRTLGYYVEEVISFADKVFLTGGVRRDAASAFGRDFRSVYYPKVGLSWLVSEQGFFPQSDFVNTLRLRATYGASGQIPGAQTALRFFNTNTVSLPNGSDASGVTLGSLGNSALKPEYSAEFEGGFDLALFNNRTNIDFTYYNKQTTDALISRQLAPSVAGVGTRTENIGDIQNQGLELTWNQRVIDRPGFAADFMLTGSTNKNQMTAIAEGVTAIFTGNRNTQRNQPGSPLYGLWGRQYTYEDKNNDGIIVYFPSTSPLAAQNELFIADSATFIGPSFPTRELAFTPTIELLNRKLRISGQIDSKWGHKKFNNTLRHQCQNGVSCRGMFDKSASLDEQAAARATNGAAVFTGMFEDGAFTRFREASVSYELPASWANAVRAQRMNVVVTGRNLGVRTNYTGVDPEASANSGDERGNEE
ncbi:MAG TPA: SusC/RagA family TonB-linked outer membrane protein, partial [Gemmatimonas sp.]|nr:SusC/RagA family TonB-linked outer membrane protein [Gemmatimonas sp.]